MFKNNFLSYKAFAFLSLESNSLLLIFHKTLASLICQRSLRGKKDVCTSLKHEVTFSPSAIV